MVMSQVPQKHGDGRPHTSYWMRAVSFAGLHRLLRAVADSPDRCMTAGQINELVLQRHVSLTHRNPAPAPTTLYHYRNTLLQLGLLRREGRKLYVNDDDPDVRELSAQPAPSNGNPSLGDGAKDHFAALVLRNDPCRALFFDLFMPSDSSAASLSKFTTEGAPASWARCGLSKPRAAIFENSVTGSTARCASEISIAAVLYGLRYWARDELGLIDEYRQRSDGSVTMFPVTRTALSETHQNSAVMQTVRLLLSLRSSSEWTLLSVHDLIAKCCLARRQPIRVLLRAIDWLTGTWPHHTILIPTSRALATLTAASRQRENLELRSYYKIPNGPYVSHIRIHKEVTASPVEVTDHHVRGTSKIRA